MTAAQLSMERHWRRGLKALRVHQWQVAASAFDQCTRLAPGDALMWLNLARAQLKLGVLDTAAAAARQAFALDGSSILACRLLSGILMDQARFDEAAQVFDQLDPATTRDHDWYTAHGSALHLAGRTQDAVAQFFQALALKLDAAQVHYSLGLCFKDLHMTREATECFRTAMTLDSGDVRVLSLSLLVHEGRQACAWDSVAKDTQDLLAALDRDDISFGECLTPFALLAIGASSAQQRRSGELRLRGFRSPLPVFTPRRKRAAGRIRLGYLSSDFHQHATASLMTELLERRDSERFEVFLYSHSANDGTAMGQRVRTACEHFVDVTHLSKAQIAQRIYEDGIDIAIDLKGHTRGSRFELLACRPAPVQVAFLGYPASTGADFIDYLVGDRVVTPLAHAPNYSEHIAQMPHSYQPNDAHRPLLPAPTRASLGLPDDAVVLCCFNQTYKMSPQMLDLWARILADAPRAVLWMLAWNPHAQAALSRELTLRGVSDAQVFWAPKLPLDQHIARLRCADLFLDTWPCNAHTTASEALWAGVPVLTVPGETFASRVAASLVNACGLPDLAAADPDHYAQLAAALANEPEILRSLHAHLDQHRLALPLFDAERYARDFEALLLRMFERQQAGLAPAPLPAAT